jgi:cytosine/adenosine deaminase-related metal-dependent hydrolase
MNIEHELKNALQREAPRPGFADRVIARIDGGAVMVPMPARRSMWRPMAAAALLVILATGWGVVEHAKRQALLAMHITSAKLAHAQHEVLKEK